MGNKKNKTNKKCSTHKSKCVYVNKRHPTKRELLTETASLARPSPSRE